MADVQYCLTDSGKELLKAGDYLVELASEAAKDGVITAREIQNVGPELTPAEAQHVISVLHRLGLIEPVPLQGVSYDRRKPSYYLN